ncbi:ribbon-helix-helix protein, CopG family [Pengzhenrongella sicca]|uniref:Ribbon-helix-helix protein, CopG family n=1 Tax=Pengzhenrongella sicca TaxID=2819238 RepID=A0A8A4ZIZ4_9MICO|nr:ribbon-helix-helix protein, CopG family [Pengzhenrongella sicca]QTE29568.1 ribbon-helix-helix protein, CopG family [Pengzhenrongella sicca]
MSATTIKIDSAVRDRLTAHARKRGVSTGSFVEELLEAWTREERFAAIRAAMSQTAPELAASYQEDLVALDHLASDGLHP